MVVRGGYSNWVVLGRLLLTQLFQQFFLKVYGIYTFIDRTQRCTALLCCRLAVDV